MPLRTLDLFQKLTRQLLPEFGAFRIEVMLVIGLFALHTELHWRLNSAVGSLANLQVIASY
jgi:hypothetical protein